MSKPPPTPMVETEPTQKGGVKSHVGSDVVTQMRVSCGPQECPPCGHLERPLCGQIVVYQYVSNSESMPSCVRHRQYVCSKHF